MNHWTEMSIRYANQTNYLDALFKIYPTIPDGIRDIDEPEWSRVEDAYNKKDSESMIKALFKLDKFPIKDPYVAYMRRDLQALTRNPETVARICGRIYDLGLDKVYDACSEPAETNRQIGPMFKRWLGKSPLGYKPVSLYKFNSNKNNAILDGSDNDLAEFARNHLNYQGDKGLDFVARFNGQYVVGEAKFLTDFGGHQNAQFNDAISLFDETNINAIPVAILDGVLYIKGKHKMYRHLQRCPQQDIMSALVLREFLFQL